ncbi:hypothetical protein [Olleya sp. YS]|uniref:hypothetical protein n=1 Tax=Olleya sp. YS TaxID=3028318 RepID=UPI00243462A3|nr:hypothetical protein [Olleya sp. YS]WGD34516.1 hypothetical protein Ollyesu_12095 [Olleya sp. YS]
MKVTHIIFSLLFVLVTTLAISKEGLNKTNISTTVTKNVVFDGYEGNIFYFTDTNDNVVIIEALEASNILDNLQQNNHVGEAFNLQLKDLKDDNMYSEIQITAINPLKK